MKRTVSFLMILIVLVGTSLPTFAGKPAHAGKGNKGLPYGLQKRETLPPGLEKKEELPEGLQKRVSEGKEEINAEAMEALINEVESYIDALPAEDIEEASIVDAIKNLIQRIEVELEKEVPVIDRFYTNLKHKFSILKESFEEQENLYKEKLEILATELTVLLDQDVLEEDELEEINTLLEEINRLKEAERVAEEIYQELLAKVNVYLTDETIYEEMLSTLVKSIEGFIEENAFGEAIGEYSIEIKEDIDVVLAEYEEEQVEDIKVFYNSLLGEFTSLKESKVIGGEYLSILEAYRETLLTVDTSILTADEKSILNEMVLEITYILNEDKTTLKVFNEIKASYETFIGDALYNDAKLSEVLEDARRIVLNSFGETSEKVLELKKDLLNTAWDILTEKESYTTIDEYKEAIEVLTSKMSDLKDILK